MLAFQPQPQRLIINPIRAFCTGLVEMSFVEAALVMDYKDMNTTKIEAMDKKD
jgi:hypothetical protein